ncbi:hypothetical protein QYQ98_05840 [Corynebacterium sp. P3-F1]|uniref:hypothetical protein n=1 Tax=Corynebacterium sp. P3-F1 TaxID=3059080 RepID=UPI00265CA9AD|nr:hypothetical protein [Corynebacterium sp. P3-F1]WKK60588.1 hypothetical protein QYQ98_05840 [Corynebacterium sp. P3-F1]
MTHEECLEAITELEREFGMEFPFRPEPPEEVDEESQTPMLNAQAEVDDMPPF